MKKLKEMKAITLIALIITIIVLLILAGITVAQLSGNGLFEKTKLAKEVSKNAQEDEEDKIKQYGNEINNYIDGNRNITEEELNTRIQQAIAKNNENKKVLLWEGTANTDNINYFKYKDEVNGIRYTIDDFDYLCVYGDNGGQPATLMIPTNKIVTSTSSYWTLSCHHTDSYYWLSFFYFESKSSFAVSIPNTKSVGFAKGYIKQIEGLKF